MEYAPGTLEAKAYQNGTICGRDELSTVSEPASLQILPDVTGRTGKADVIFAEIAFVDQDGQTAWTAGDEVTVSARGGRVIGTGSGRVDDEHDYTSNICNAYHGRLLAAILPEDTTVTVTAKSGLYEASTDIHLE